MATKKLRRYLFAVPIFPLLTIAAYVAVLSTAFDVSVFGAHALAANYRATHFNYLIFAADPDKYFPAVWLELDHAADMLLFPSVIAVTALFFAHIGSFKVMPRVSVVGWVFRKRHLLRSVLRELPIRDSVKLIWAATTAQFIVFTAIVYLIIRLALRFWILLAGGGVTFYPIVHTKSIAIAMLVVGVWLIASRCKGTSR